DWASAYRPAGTATVRSASGRPLRHGWRRARLNSCQCPTSMWCSRCRPRSEPSPIRTRPSSTDCCSRPQPRRSLPLQAIPSTLAPTSPSPLYCTLGARTSSTILMRIASCPAPDYRRTATAGSRLGTASFFRSAYSRACFASCSCKVSKPCMPPTNCSSSPISASSSTPTRGEPYLAPLRNSEWVVYAKKPFAGPQQVLAYLARYTHRVAISNSRLLELDAAQVSFRWKYYLE